jgi:hypothetical protein
MCGWNVKNFNCTQGSGHAADDSAVGEDGEPGTSRRCVMGTKASDQPRPAGPAESQPA